MFKKNTKCVHWCLWCLIHTWLACLLVETAKVTGWRIKGHLVMTQRTNQVVLTIGKCPTCKIVSATGLAFRLSDYGIHIVNCHSSLPVPMIQKWCIGAVWKLRCVYVIYKMKKIVLDMFYKCLVNSWLCMSPLRSSYTLSNARSINIQVIIKHLQRFSIILIYKDLNSPIVLSPQGSSFFIFHLLI